MKYIIKPSQHVAGEIVVPGDKSISHRAIMLASIANGTSTITGFLEGDDCLATLGAFKKMGVEIEQESTGVVTVKGVGKRNLLQPVDRLDLGNSGTSMRLMAGLLSGQPISTELVGDQSLMKRPMRRVCDPLSEMGARVSTASDGTPPIEIHPVKQLNAISYRLPVASAQVKSAILFAALYAQGKTEVFEPKPTRDHTERMLQSFSYPIEVSSSYIALEGGVDLQPTDIQVPADISSAAFFIVAACIAREGELTMHNVGINPTRTGVLDILQAMNASIDISSKSMMGGEPVATITARTSQLTGIDVPPHLVPSAIDEFPIICIAAACAKGVTRITQAEELRVKESDRIKQMADGLTALGIEIEEFHDGLSITGGEFSGGSIESGHDHRIAMSFAIASLRASNEIEISDCENVATSFPGFSEIAQRLGLQLSAVS
ncbi:MAG: 3-phosphoshikimate 1-carboxyvinyltransferase [Pseudomonadota bacterium]